MERIAAAAVLYHGEIKSLPQPARHCHVLWSIDNYDHSGQQGFVTDTGRFVDRQEGFDIADVAGQILRVTGSHGTLFSEDMW